MPNSDSPKKRQKTTKQVQFNLERNQFFTIPNREMLFEMEAPIESTLKRSSTVQSLKDMIPEI